RIRCLSFFKHLYLKCFPVRGIQPADYESDWMLMVSQNSQKSFKEVEHGLEEVPLKVKVLVKPIRGPYEGWIFEADSSSWTLGRDSPALDQAEQRVLVKVMTWRSSSLPVPDLQTNWISIDTTNSFVEVQHNESVGLNSVQLQTRCLPSNTDQILYSDAVGAGSKPPLDNIDLSRMVGLIFAYDRNKIRVWAPEKGRAYIMGFGDGYFRYKSKSQNCEFRATGWKSLGQEPETFRFTLNGLNTSAIPDISALQLNTTQCDPLKNYIQVQVKALDGPNGGFLFPASGQAHRNAFSGTTYSGLLFAYSTDSIRIFVPANDTGTMIHLPDNWDETRYTQMSNTVEIIINIWTITSDQCRSSKKYTNGFLKRHGTDSCPKDAWIKCAILCLSDPDCVGMSPCHVIDQCLLMGLNVYNNKILTGELGIKGDIYFRKLTCN
ncbi:hypothetical protein LSH36_161g16045, partial [Paralvinella palmiformis]